MSEHHPRGMSKWPAMLECAAFVGKGASKDASMGTEMHARLASLLTELKNTGTLPPCDADEDYHGAGVYRAASIIRDCMIANNVRPEELHIEERVETEDGVFGTADVWFWGRATNTIVVWDFKTFRNPGRDYTAQLAGYALAICQQRELAGGVPPAEVSVRVLYGDSKEVDMQDLSLYELQHVAEQAMAAFDVADKGEAQPTQCNWCELCAKFTACPACTAVAEVVTKPIYASIPAQWETLPVEQKAQMLVLAETVCKWSDSVHEKAKADLMSGATIEDEANGIRYCLRNVSGRKTPRTAEACRMLLERGVEPDALRGELTLAVKSIKELLKTVGVKGEAADELIAQVCDIAEGTVQMVRG